MNLVSSVMLVNAVKPRNRPGQARGHRQPLKTTTAKQDRVVDVELNRMVFDDDPADTYVSWHAEWGLRDSSVGTEDSGEDLAVLVESVLPDVRSMADGYTVRLEWTVDGDLPEGKAIADVITELGVQLPEVMA